MQIAHRTTNTATGILALFALAFTAGCNNNGDGGNDPPNPPPGGGTATIERISDGDGPSRAPAISSNGNFVAFESVATNLVASDTNGVQDIFVLDRAADTMERVSVDSAAQQGTGASRRPAISANGRYVVFESDAEDLVADDTNFVTDVFVHDRQTGTTTRVSVDSGGVEADAASTRPAISADGRYVAFQSDATNLVAGDTNLSADIFLHDRQTNATTRVSLDSSGLEVTGASANPALSADGRFVAFTSAATDLVASDTNGVVDVFVRDVLAGATTRISQSSLADEADAASGAPAISADGRYIAFPSTATNLVTDDTNAASDVFLHDRQLAATTRVSVSSASIEGDGASPPPGSTARPALSSNGRFVTFTSTATNLVTGDTNGAADVFRHDVVTGETRRLNVDAGGVAGTGDAVEDVSTAVSSSGEFVAFQSADDGLVPGDTNGEVDVFVRFEPTSAALTVGGATFEPPSAFVVTTSGVALGQGALAPLPLVRRLPGLGAMASVQLEPPVLWAEARVFDAGEDARVEVSFAPAGLAPGLYRTTARMFGNGELAGEFAVVLEVLD